MRSGRDIGSILLAALLLAPMAAAQEGAGGPAGGDALGACEADVEKLCSDVQPGALRLVRCLGRQREALSDACRDALSSERVRTAEQLGRLQESCASDAPRLCAQARGPLHLVDCLQKHRDQVSAPCREALPEPPPKTAPAPEAEPDAGNPTR